MDEGNNKARLVVLIDSGNKAAFEAACSARDMSASEVLRQLIEDYMARHDAKAAGHGLAGSESAN